MSDTMTMRRLANGLVEVYARRAQLSGLYQTDGTPHSGDLARSRRRHEISRIVREFAASGAGSANIAVRG
jgi:hypothetical protein